MDGLEVIDQPTEDLVFDDQQQVDEPKPDETAEPADQQAPEDKVDGRRFNPEWSKALKELREQFPDRADMLTKLRDNYARYQALQEIAPKGLEDVRGWKTQIDALGGAEAAADMMQRVANMEQVDAKIEAGDFSVIGELPENLQKGFYGMIPDALTTLSEKDPAAFSAAVMPHFASALAGTGMGEHLKAMYAKAEGNEELQGLIKQQYDWFQQQTSGRSTIPGGAKSADPQVARLQAELDRRAKGDEEAFVNGIAQTANTHLSDTFSKGAEVYMKQLGLNDQQKADLMASFNGEMTAKLAGDAAFQKQLAAYKSLKNRNPDTINSFVKAKIDENAKSVLDNLVKVRYGTRQQKAAPAPVASPNLGSGVTRVAATPDRSEWDMAKMDAAGYESTAKIGKFFLSGGRTVQVVRQ